MRISKGSRMAIIEAYLLRANVTLEQFRTCRRQFTMLCPEEVKTLWLVLKERRKSETSTESEIFLEKVSGKIPNIECLDLNDHVLFTTVGLLSCLIEIDEAEGTEEISPVSEREVTEIYSKLMVHLNSVLECFRDLAALNETMKPAFTMVEVFVGIAEVPFFWNPRISQAITMALRSVIAPLQSQIEEEINRHERMIDLEKEENEN